MQQHPCGRHFACKHLQCGRGVASFNVAHPGSVEIWLGGKFTIYLRYGMDGSARIYDCF